MASTMDMAAPETGMGLAAAAAARTGAVVGSAVPVLPAGTPITPFTTVLEGLLVAATADVSTRTAFGAATAAASVTAVETTETLNASTLTT
ncbi:hypothetical protein JNN96_37280 [Mycobacterium sp. DSM 3803]|nr:hypothetical protein [Mycobacterium sp. DSM 3803]